MSITLHDAVKSALIKEAKESQDFCGSHKENLEALQAFMTPIKYKRMWKKITGKTITLEEAQIAIAKAQPKVEQGERRL